MKKIMMLLVLLMGLNLFTEEVSLFNSFDMYYYLEDNIESFEIFYTIAEDIPEATLYNIRVTFFSDAFGKDMLYTDLFIPVVKGSYIYDLFKKGKFDIKIRLLYLRATEEAQTFFYIYEAKEVNKKLKKVNVIDEKTGMKQDS